MKHIYTFLFSIIFCSYGFSQYHFNKAAHFSDSAYFQSVNEANFDFGGPITIEAWIKPDSVISNMGIVGKNYATSYYFGLHPLSPNNAVLRFSVAGQLVNGTDTIPINQWTHVAVTYNGAGVTTFHINGIVDPISSGAAAGAIPNTSDDFRIGCDQQGGSPAYFFTGAIDEVRIWDAVLPPAQIASQRCIPLGIDYAGGVSFYSGAEESFRMNLANATDTMFSEVWPYSQLAPVGVSLLNYSNKTSPYIDYNSHLRFDGNSEYSIMYNFTPIDMRIGKSMTAEVWVRMDSTVVPPGGYMNIFNQSGGTNEYPFAIYTNSSNGQVYFEINAGTTQTNGGNIRDQRWHHLAGTYSDNTGHMELFIDGVLIDSTTSPADSLTQSAYRYYLGSIGASSFANNRLVGGVDEARIWRNVVRTPAEIKKYMYTGLDQTFVDPDIDSLIVFGLDGITRESNLDIGQQMPKYFGVFSGTSDVRFASSKIGINAAPTSPLLRLDANNYPVDFIMSHIHQPIPDMVPLYDTIAISGLHITADPTGVEVVLLANHTFIGDLSVWLFNSQGDSVQLAASNSVGCSGNDVMTIFSNGADSTYSALCPITNNLQPSSPSVKPVQNFSAVMNGSPNGNWWLKVIDDYAGATGYWHAWGLRISGYYIGVEPMSENTFRSYNFPNPFNGTTTIYFDLPFTKDVQLKIYDQSGRILRNQLIGDAVQGANYYQIDLSDLASGVYFYELTSGDSRVVNKMIIR